MISDLLDQIARKLARTDITLEWRASRYGLRHAIPAGQHRALCGQPPVRGSEWLPADRCTDRTLCSKCFRLANWPAAQLAGRIAALPPVPQPAGPRERYLASRGLIP